jgi:prephenate dehydrogenase
MIEKICIIGVGLIGSSLAKALKNTGQAKFICGYGRDAARLEKAKELSIIDDYSIKLKEAVINSDIVIIATPVGSYEEVLVGIKPYLKSDTLVTDVGSTKRSVIEAAEKVFGNLPHNFIPAHPIAGKEKSGFEACDGELFVNKKVIITPLENNDDESISRVQNMWEKVGSEVDFMTPESHDELLGMTSHLPHMLAFSLMNYLISQNPSASVYAAGGFKDFTRIASGDNVMWRDICLNNKDQIIAHIEGYQKSLSALSEAIDNGDIEQLDSIFSNAKASRESWLD